MIHDCFSKTLIALAAVGVLLGSAAAPVCADDLSKTVEIRLPSASRIFASLRIFAFSAFVSVNLRHFVAHCLKALPAFIRRIVWID